MLEAAGRSNGRAALEELCRIYWPAIYASVRRRGYNVEDAQDMTQSFFQHILENDTLRRVSRERGRFRSFLLGALTLCLADEQARRNTLKRGAGVRFISAEELDKEELHIRKANSVQINRSMFAGLGFYSIARRIGAERVRE